MSLEPEKKGQHGAYTSPPKRAKDGGNNAAFWLAGAVAVALVAISAFQTPAPVKTAPEAPAAVAKAPEPPAPVPVTDSTKLLVPGEGSPAAAADEEPRPVAPVPAQPRNQPPAAAQTPPPASDPQQTRVDLHWVHDNHSEYLLNAAVRVFVDGVDLGLQRLEARENDHLKKMRLHINDDVPDEIVHQAGSEAKLTAQGQRQADYYDEGNPKDRSPECIIDDRADDNEALRSQAWIGNTICPSWSRPYNIATRVRLILPVLNDTVPHTVKIKKVAMVDGPGTSSNYLVTDETFTREPGAHSAWKLADTQSKLLYAKKIYVKQVGGKTIELYEAPNSQLEGFWPPAPKGKWRTSGL